MRKDIKGKVVWITGAGTGIGAAAALALAEAGCSLVLSGRRQDKLDEVAGQLKLFTEDVLVLSLDVADRASVDQAVSQIQDQFGRLDILVNSAGLNIPGRSWDQLDPSDWDTVLSVNLNGAYYTIQAALPLMREQQDGLIVNVSSWAGRYVARVSGPAYVAAKHAMNAMTESLNQEEWKYGIRACAICPGEVATELLDKRAVPVSKADKDKMLQAEDLGDMILYVCQAPPHVCINEILISPTWNRLAV